MVILSIALPSREESLCLLLVLQCENGQTLFKTVLQSGSFCVLTSDVGIKLD
jgi:hypothetical protein